MAAVIRETAFEPWEELRRYQSEALDHTGRIGATATFVGTMRDFREGDSVHAMVLEHYPGMTEAHLHRITDEARARWDIIDALIIHRVGIMRPGDPIVLVVVWAAHRSDAFGACRYLIEELKSRAPFWKKESLTGEERWVEHNTPATDL